MAPGWIQSNVASCSGSWAYGSNLGHWRSHPRPWVPSPPPPPPPCLCHQGYEKFWKVLRPEVWQKSRNHLKRSKLACVICHDGIRPNHQTLTASPPAYLDSYSFSFPKIYQHFLRFTDAMQWLLSNIVEAQMHFVLFDSYSVMRTSFSKFLEIMYVDVLSYVLVFWCSVSNIYLYIQ